LSEHVVYDYMILKIQLSLSTVVPLRTLTDVGVTETQTADVQEIVAINHRQRHSFSNWYVIVVRLWEMAAAISKESWAEHADAKKKFAQ
jgi:hypothetical protein